MNANCDVLVLHFIKFLANNCFYRQLILIATAKVVHFIRIQKSTCNTQLLGYATSKASKGISNLTAIPDKVFFGSCFYFSI